MFETFGLYVHIPYCRTKCPYCDFNVEAAADLARGALRRRADRRAPATRERSAVRRQATGDDLSRRRHALVVRRRIDRPLARPSAPRVCRRDDGRNIARSDPRVRRGREARRLPPGGRESALLRHRVVSPSRPEATRPLADRGRDTPGRGDGARGRFRQRQSRPDVRRAGAKCRRLAHRPRHRDLARPRAHLRVQLDLRGRNTVLRPEARGKARPARRRDRSRDVRGSAQSPGERRLPGVRSLELRPARLRSAAQPELLARRTLPGNRRGGAFPRAARRAARVAGRTKRTRPSTRVARCRGGGAVVAKRCSEPRKTAGEFVFLHLRTSEGVGEEAFRARFGSPLEETFPEVEQLLGDGLLERHADRRLALSPRGLLLADSVFASFV